SLVRDIFPTERTAALEHPRRSFPKHIRQILWQQPIAWADRTDIAVSQRLTKGDILDHIKRPTENKIFALHCAALIVYASKRLPGGATVIYQSLKFARLQTECSIVAPISATQGKMFFNHARAHCYGSNRARRAWSVIGKATDYTE